MKIDAVASAAADQTACTMCKCVHERMCMLHLLFLNLLYRCKMVSSPQSQLLIWSLIIMFQQEC